MDRLALDAARRAEHVQAAGSEAAWVIGRCATGLGLLRLVEAKLLQERSKADSNVDMSAVLKCSRPCCNDNWSSACSIPDLMLG